MELNYKYDDTIFQDEKYLRFGYRPGNYQIKCTSCEVKYSGDKLSWKCRWCALEDYDMVYHPKPSYTPHYDRPVDYTSAIIESNSHCGDCGWPVIHCCVNGSMVYIEPYDEWDWWEYCSNKTCKNHEGEGLFQNKIKWIITTTKENKI